MADIEITNKQLMDIWARLTEISKVKRVDGQLIGNETFKWGIARNKKLLETDRLLLARQGSEMDADEERRKALPALLESVIQVRVHKIKMVDVPAEVSAEDRFILWDLWDLDEPSA